MSELPKGWVFATIGDVCVKPEQRIPDSDESFKYIDIGSIDRSEKRICNPTETLGTDAPSRARKVVNTNDVLVSMTRPNLNAVALVPAELNNQIASTGFDVLKPVIIDSKWIFAVVRSKQFIDAISGETIGALYPACKAEDIRNYAIPIPPKAEQTRIVEKLDEVLAQVDAIKTRLDSIPSILKRFRQSVLAAAVSGRLTEEWRERKQLTAPILVNLENLLRDKKHLSYGVLKPGDVDPSGVKMIRVMDLSGWGDFLPNEIYKISNQLSEQFKRTIVETGDIVLAVMATVGRAAIIPDSLAGSNVNRALAVLKLNSQILSKFMLYQVMSPAFQSEFVEKKLGSAQKRINLADLRLFKVILPEISEQKEIVRLVDQYFAFADTIEAQVKKAQMRVDNLTQSILAKAFRGELVAQDPSDEPAEKLLERIAQARKEAESLAKAAKKVAKTK